MSDNQPGLPFQSSWQALKATFSRVLFRLAAAIAFYTCLPVPATWVLEFEQVSRWVSLIGLIIGSLLALLDIGLTLLGMPLLTRSTILVVTWLALTGGLHFDGAMDTADGLAVFDRDRRLEVMADSRTGAFGVMVAIALLLLKTTALTDLTFCRGLALILVPAWGRWGQQVAIARYPYLKPTGKGAFHKAALPSLKTTLPNLFLLVGFSTLPCILGDWQISLGLLAGGAIAFWVPAWFNHRLGGHTGDTYGAVVEWTEALLLVLLAGLAHPH